MELVRTMTKCLCVIGIFILPLIAVTVGYHIWVDFLNSGKLLNLNNFLTGLG